MRERISRGGGFGLNKTDRDFIMDIASERREDESVIENKEAVVDEVDFIPLGNSKRRERRRLREWK